MRHPSQPQPSPLSLFLNFFHQQPAQDENDSDFLNSLVHELKTPLNAVISFSEMLQQDIKDPLAAKECIDYTKEINRAALDLDELIHDLLDVGSAKSGNFSADLSEKIDISEIIRRSIRLNYAYALKRQIRIESKISSDVKSINLDEKRMKQILSNLLSNAIKYSRDNSVISVKASVKDNSLEIKVIDRGFGMTAEQITRAFEKYQTIKNPNSGKVDSFGLGLPITKELVELQNGKIEMKSEVGKGTEIILNFPI